MRLVPRAVAALILASTCALGAPTDQREKLYTEGLGCLEKRSFACAATKFRDALAIKSTAAVVHALGLAERGSGHPLRARELFRQAVKDAEKEKDADTIRGARAALDAIDQEIPRLVLRLPGDVTPTRALVDGREVDVEEGGIAIEPGQHTLVVEAAGRSPFRSSFVAKAGTIGKSAGDRVEVSVTFTAIGPQDPGGGAVAAPPRREPATNGPPTGAIVLGGVGVALGIGALVWWQRGSSESDGANLDAEACTAPCPADRQAEILAKHDQGSSRVRTAQYLGAASVGLVIGSAVWWALTPSASPASARVTAAPASGGGFVSLTTRFLG